MVMYAPGGIASLIMMNLRVFKFGKLGGLLGGYLALALTGAVMFVGAAAMIEMLYHLQLNTSMGSTLRFMSLDLNVQSAASWLVALFVTAVGFVMLEFARRRFARRWGDVQGDIEAEISAREAA
jgi:branched-chain amino acid transport system permease protein